MGQDGQRTSFGAQQSNPHAEGRWHCKGIRARRLPGSSISTKINNRFKAPWSWARIARTGIAIYSVRMKKLLATITIVLLCSSCSGLRQTEGTFSTHATSFRILGFAIPGDDGQAAYGLVPEGATITTVQATPVNWTSIIGVLQNILGFSTTQIGGTLPDTDS